MHLGLTKKYDIHVEIEMLYGMWSVQGMGQAWSVQGTGQAWSVQGMVGVVALPLIRYCNDCISMVK